jgi:hypothetical protein
MSNEATLALAGASQLLLTPEQSIAMTSVGYVWLCYISSDKNFFRYLQTFLARLSTKTEDATPLMIVALAMGGGKE